jgi:hypothetical protein
MRIAHRFFAVLLVAVTLASGLPGCATRPLPPLDGRLQFPQYKFSVNGPPADWAPTDPKIPGEFAAWTNAATRSRIGIQAHKPLPDGSLRSVVEAFKAGMTPGTQDRPGTVAFTVKDEKEINLDGKRFYRVILGNRSTPADFIFYFLRGEEFVFSLSLAVFPGSYEKDLAVLEHMARGVGS